MLQRCNKGLGNWPKLTERSYLKAVEETVNSLKGDHSEAEMATAWGVSTGTVGNAVNQRHALTAVPMLKLAERFGADAINTILSLVGIKAVPAEAIVLSPEEIAAVPCKVAETVPTLIRLLADGDASDADIRQMDREGVIDCFIEIADLLQQRRDALALRSVA